MTVPSIDAVLGHNAAVMVTEAPAECLPTDLSIISDDGLRAVVITPPPGRVTSTEMAGAVLAGLGKRHDVNGKPRHSSTERELVSLWLTAHRTRLLIVTNAQTVNRAGLLALVEMLQTSPTSVLFVADHNHLADLIHALQAAAPVEVPWPEVDAVTDTDTPTTNDNARSLLASLSPGHRQTVPAEEYWTFYATARRVLPAARFKHLDALYRDSLNRVADWLDGLGQAEQPLTVSASHQCITALVSEQTTYDDVTTVIRAAQAAHHNAGWYLDVDERELRAGLARFTMNNISADLFQRLRAYREPARAAVVALYLAGATPLDIKAVTVSDLAAWQQDPDLAVAAVHPPDYAAPYLRAALLARAADAAASADPAFHGSRRRVNLDIRQAATDLDINIGDANINETSTIHARRVPKNIVKLESFA